MAMNVAFADAHSQAIVDLEIGLEVNQARAIEIAGLLVDDVIHRTPMFTNSLYRVDGGEPEKAEADVALTLLTMATRLMVAKRMSVRGAVNGAVEAIKAAVAHAREIEKRNAEKREKEQAARASAAA